MTDTRVPQDFKFFLTAHAIPDNSIARGQGWSVTAGRVEVNRATSIKDAKKRTVTLAEKALYDAWREPFTWVDLGGQTYTVWVAGPEHVVISCVRQGPNRNMYRRNVNNSQAPRRLEWDDQPWRYLIEYAQTNLERMFDFWGKIARGESNEAVAA